MTPFRYSSEGPFEGVMGIDRYFIKGHIGMPRISGSGLEFRIQAPNISALGAWVTTSVVQVLGRKYPLGTLGLDSQTVQPKLLPNKPPVIRCISVDEGAARGRLLALTPEPCDSTRALD